MTSYIAAVADRAEHAKDKLVSPVDPDARTGKKTSKTWPGYKAHILMEEETVIITEVGTTPANATDGSQLQPLLKEQEQVHSLKPQELTADKAYDWGENLESLAGNGTIANIALTKQVNHRGVGYFTVDDFLYDPENTKLMCRPDISQPTVTPNSSVIITRSTSRVTPSGSGRAYAMPVR